MNHRERALHLVKTEIDRAIARPACPQCRSTWIKDHATPAPRGATWTYKICLECEEVFDAEMEA